MNIFCLYKSVCGTERFHYSFTLYSLPLTNPIRKITRYCQAPTPLCNYSATGAINRLPAIFLFSLTISKHT